MSPPLCPECGNIVYPSADLDFGNFGALICAECGWEEDAALDPDRLVLPADCGDASLLCGTERLVLAWVAATPYPFKCLAAEIEQACEALCAKGFLRVMLISGEFRYTLAR